MRRFSNDKAYDRRDLFKALGASALLLHPLLSSREGYGQAEVKQRFLCFLTSSGVRLGSFYPTGDANTYSLLGQTTEPLQPFLPDLTIIKGLLNDPGPHDAHNSGAVSLLTGEFQRNENNINEYAFSASIDQMIADRVQAKTSRRSLEMAILPTVLRTSRFISFNATGRGLDQLTDPYLVFNSIFKDLIGGATDTASADNLAKIKAKRKSILDAIRGDLADASRISGLNAEEKAKLDSYLESIRQIERSLDSTVATPSQSAAVNLDGFTKLPKINVENKNYADIARLMMDLIIAAFQLDVTRVATLVWSAGGSDGVPSIWRNFNGQPIPESYHALTHTQVDPVNFDAKLKILDTYHAGEFAYLIGRMKAIKENNGTLLDNSLAMWTSEIGDGVSHSPNIPMILAGKAGGALPAGRFMNLSNTPHQRLLISILHAFGLKDKTSIGRSGPNVQPLL